MQTNCEANIFAMKCFPTNWLFYATNNLMA